MEDKFVVLKTNLGQLRGQIKTSIYFHKRYCAFRGIPYGKPPIGDLRFKAPQPYGSWEGVRDALTDGNSCMQPFSMLHDQSLEPDKISFGDEDCLFLNVYMNKPPETSTSKKPVMCVPHGGGFTGGSGGFDYFGPDFFMNEDVVLVTINYRCGAFGFLSLENEEVPGNAGLKDQTLALRWVRDNIHSFGGDPNNVTIFGMSAGGASVNYHLLSQTSKGLFHKAAIQSGCSNNIWAFQPKPRNFAVMLAKTLGCFSENDNEILQFLQSVSAEDIVYASKNMGLSLNEKFETMKIAFKPCVEVAGTNPFLSDTPENLMKKGHFQKVPIIFGSSENDGTVCTMELAQIMDKENFETLKETPELLVPQSMKLKIKSGKTKEAGQRIWDFYFRDKTLSWEKQLKNFLTYVGDVYFYIEMEKTRSYLLEMSPFPVFSYLFTNHTRCLCMLVKKLGSDSLGTNIAPIYKETCHSADEPFLAEFRFLPHLKFTPEHRVAVEKHIKAWCRFASVGDPNCEELGLIWEKDSVDKPCYMDIGTSWVMKRGRPLTERMEFWKHLLE